MFTIIILFLAKLFNQFMQFAMLKSGCQNIVTASNSGFYAPTNSRGIK